MEDFKSLPKMQCFKTGGSVAAFTKRDRKETDSADIAQDKKIVKKTAGNSEFCLQVFYFYQIE